MAGAGIRTDIAGYGRGVSRYGRSAGAPGLALTALRLSSLDDDLLRNWARDLDASRYSANSYRLRAQMVKGGKQVRGANENYRTAYLMCVLYAFVVIVLAAVFLL
jgi:hypothetical protein